VLLHCLHLQRCIEAIAENAFKTSPYPVIITLENHTDEPNQKQMAATMRQILGCKLYLPTAEDRKRDYKSPEELKHKVRGWSPSGRVRGLVFRAWGALWLGFRVKSECVQGRRRTAASGSEGASADDVLKA